MTRFSVDTLPHEAAVHVAVMREPLVQAPPHIEPVQQARSEPKPRVRPKQTPLANPQLVPKAEAETEEAVASLVTAKTVPAAPQAQPSKPTQVAAETSAVQAPPLAKVPQDLALEASFNAQVRQLIESKKHYPTGRQFTQQKPKGQPHVCVTLARSGQILSSRLERKSGEPLLDKAAMNLLRDVAYSSFPEKAFIGRESNEFCVTLAYEYAH